MTTPRDIASICQWCGHPAHLEPCPRNITTRSGRNILAEPCPCAKHLKGTP